DMFSFVFLTTEPANRQPLITIAAPQNGARITQGNSVTIDVNASDAAPGSVAKVEFYLNGQLVATDTEAPYSYTTAVYEGPENVIIDALVEDNEGARVWAEKRSYSIVPPEGEGGLYFDGLKDYVSFGDDPALKLSTFTLETWF